MCVEEVVVSARLLGERNPHLPLQEFINNVKSEKSRQSRTRFLFRDMVAKPKATAGKAGSLKDSHPGSGIMGSGGGKR